MTKPRILVIGTGSVGKRHATNLIALGCSISGVDPRRDRRQEFESIDGVATSYESVGAAFDGSDYDGVVIATPPILHIPQSAEVLAVQDVPLLIEKPLATTLSAAREWSVGLERPERILVGYTWRWSRALRHIRELLKSRRIGEFLHARGIMSSHLEDWHPWERYQDFYMSQAALGGGALLDESHWIDLFLWLLGRPTGLFATVGKISALEIDADDNVDVLLMYSSGRTAYLHLDLFGRPHETSLQIVGSQGRIDWSERSGVVSVSLHASPNPEEFHFPDSRNEMFASLAREFLELVLGKRAELTCSISDGLAALAVIDAARESQRQKARALISIAESE
ncbi:MAG TPA: Gfo/Idh/MocA family oxidoreductase [Actinomycetota bacterium]|nr:Gfo/Idh/MocA family oxidoreductase [Actinomycetota bacterium]